MEVLNKQILISGASGYIGSNLIRHLSNLNENIIITKRTSDSEFEYFYLNNQKFSIENFINSEIILVHLATFFSKNKEDKKKLKISNLEFGKSIVKDLESFNLSKVIYTNTMYQHYKDKKIRQLMYTKTKSDFSIYLSKTSKSKSFLYEEIFLDNTFGNLDNRPKVIPIIIESIINNKPNPILNPDAFINLVHVDNVVERLKVAIYSKDSTSSTFISEKSVNLNSLYEFLLNYKLNNKINNEIINFKSNEYEKNYPKVDLKNIELNNLGVSLIEEYKSYENR